MSDSFAPLSRQNRRLAAAVAALLGLNLAPVSAATFTWQGATTGDWSNGSNWVGGVAPTGTNGSDVLIFGGTSGAYTATDNVAGPFLLNRLELNATDLISQRTLAAATGSFLQFGGSGAQILQSGPGNFTVKIPITATGPLEFGGSGANSVVTLDGPVSGIFNITKTGSNTFRFGSLEDLAPSGNTWTGTLTIENGTVRFNNNAFAAPTALRSNPVVLNNASAVLSTQFKKSVADGALPPAPSNADPKSSLRVGTLSGSAGLVLARRETATSATTFDSADIVITALVDGTFAGTVRNKANTALGAGETAGSNDGELVIRGTANQTFTGVLDISKDVIVGNSATLTLAGSASLSAQSSGSIVFNGGTLRLDNRTTNNPNRLRDGTATSTSVDSIGGGVLSLIGNAAGTLELVGRLQLGTDTKQRSGALTINVTQPVGSTAGTELRFQSLNRENSASQFNTVNFTATDTNGTPRDLGQAGSNNPRISFVTNPATGFGGLLVNSAITVVGSGTGWATVTRANNGNAPDMDFATVGANGVTAVTTQSGFAGSGTTTNVRLTTGATIDSSGTTNAASVKFAPDSAGQQLTLSGGGQLRTNAFLLAGANDFSIVANGASGISGSGPRFFHVQQATLTVGAPLTGASQPIVKAGAGTLALTAPNNVTLVQPTVINEGVLRATPGSSLPGGDVRLRGGVLELLGDGVSPTTFTRQIGIGANRVNWADPTVGEDRGSGGFAAIGSDTNVTITGFNGETTVSWEDTGFVESGYALTFGSRSADRVVTWLSNLGLTTSDPAYPSTNPDGTLASTAPNYDAREIRVYDNPVVTTDRARISGAISGSLHDDLLKTGAGLLELSGANTYNGATLLREGTLLVNGSTASFLTDVYSGATLGGRGNVRSVRIQAGATLAPGEIAGFNGQTSAFTINGDLNFSGGTSKLQFELALGSYDQVKVNGSVFLDGADLVGSLLTGFFGQPTDLFFLIINDGTDPIQGQVAQGSSINVDGQAFEISYFGDSASQTFTGGNDVVLRPIPEPATTLLLGAGLLLLGGRKRKRSR